MDKANCQLFQLTDPSTLLGTWNTGMCGVRDLGKLVQFALVHGFALISTLTFLPASVSDFVCAHILVQKHLKYCDST